MSNNKNEPAFPYHTSTLTQLTKREYFAGMALQGLLSNPALYASKDMSRDLINTYSRYAISQADDIMEMLEQTK